MSSATGAPHAASPEVAAAGSTSIASSPVSASGPDFCLADDSRALPGEEHGNLTFRDYCSFIEQPSASCALASHAFASFHVTSPSPGLIYPLPPLRIFSGRGSSVPTTMLSKHIFFLVQVSYLSGAKAFRSNDSFLVLLPCPQKRKCVPCSFCVRYVLFLMRCYCAVTSSKTQGLMMIRQPANYAVQK